METNTTTTTHADRYSDERLTADLTCGLVGYERAAAVLLEVPLEFRAIVATNARRMVNATGTRYSDAMRSCKGDREYRSNR